MDWYTPELEQQLFNWRHHLHQNPELGFQEEGTAAFIEEALKSFGNIEVSRPTKTSILGVLQGAHPGKTLLMRADIDALPVQEEADLPYKSQNAGVMHACGHDTHAAMLLTAAKALSGMTDKLHGTIKFIFQHAEEVLPGGAKEILATGALGEYDAAIGVHTMSGYPAGTLNMVPEGAGSTNADGLELTIQGRGAHGSTPHQGIDPVVIGAEIVLALQTVVSRSVPPGEMAVVSVGSFQAGTVSNVMPDTGKLLVSVRSVNDQTRDLLEKRIKEIVDGICKAHGATYKAEYLRGYPAIQQDKEFTAFAKSVAQRVAGEDKVQEVPRLGGSEDFSYYGQKAPATFVMLGGGSAAEGYPYTNHHPKFCIDEDKSLPIGVKFEVETALEYLKG